MANKVQWSKQYIKELLDNQNITSAKCESDGSIALSCFYKGRSQFMTPEKILLPESQELSDFLDLVGPMRIGELKIFWDYQKESQDEPVAESIRAAVSSGYYSKVELLSDGSLKVHAWNDLTESLLHKIFPGDSQEASAILEITGPLKVGEVHEFKPSSD